MILPKIPTIDPAMMAAAFSGRKGASVAGGFALAIAVAAAFPDRWSAAMALFQGIEWYVAGALLGLSVWASAKNAKDEPDA